MGMSDGVESANLLFDLYSDSQDEITTVFEKYHQSRKGPCKTAINVSHQNGSLVHNKSLFADFAHYLVLNYIPDWIVVKKESGASNGLCHQVNFLPYAQFRGTLQPKVNPPSCRLVPGSTIPTAV